MSSQNPGDDQPTARGLDRAANYAMTQRLGVWWHRTFGEVRGSDVLNFLSRFGALLS